MRNMRKIKNVNDTISNHINKKQIEIRDLEKELKSILNIWSQRDLTIKGKIAVG